MKSPSAIKLSNNSDPYQISDGKHVMLTYNNQEDQARAAAYWINRTDEGAVYIYASVHALDLSHPLGIEKLCSKIKDCKENIQKKNLKIVDFEPYFKSALRGNLFPFEELKNYLENAVDDRIANGEKSRIIVFADAGCKMCELKLFGKSEVLERWWQDAHDKWIDNNYDITVIRPHPQFILKNEPDSEFRIMESHDILVDLNKYDLNYMVDRPANEKVLNILIMELDPDLMTLYAEFLQKGILVPSSLQRVLNAYQQ
jgi:hypothetical protein